MARKPNVHQKVSELVEQYLFENIGEMAVASAPRFDEERQRWVVMILCETPRGILPAGKLEFDKELNLIYAASRSDMVRAVEEQLRRLPHLVFAEPEALKAKGFEAITLH